MIELVRNADEMLLQNLQRYAELWAAIKNESTGMLCRKAVRDGMFLKHVLAGKRSLNLIKYRQIVDFIEADLKDMIPELEANLAEEREKSARRIEAMEAQIRDLTAFLKNPNH